jgi:two-component system sensor histidine kinase BaeS
MEALIRDVMDLEMADSLGHATMTPYHLASLAQQAVRRNQERATSRSITLEYHVINKPPHTLKGHAVLIMQTIDNLVSNAVKYTPNGGRVEVISTVEGEFAVIRVKDTGYGIPADKLEAIFEPFVRIRDPRTQQTPGTGLGLSLVKAFVEAHGGTVTVTSEMDKGSEFAVFLPLTLQAAVPVNTTAIQRIDLSGIVESKGTV